MKTTISREDLARLLGAKTHHEERALVVEVTEEATWTQQFAHAVAGRGPVFLANPDWGERERAQFDVLLHQQAEDFDSERGWLMIPTGGSSGAMKLARHDQATLAAATGGFLRHFGLSCVHSLGTLPRHHVGGLMAWLRSVLTGGTWLEASWRRLAEGGYPTLPHGDMVVSLVPAQITRLRHESGGAEWLQQFHMVLVGGAALDAATAAWARELGIRLAPSYGATETGAMSAAMLPEAFARGDTGEGQVLPHLDSRLSETGELNWRGPSLFRGYWPQSREDLEWWASGDLAEIDSKQNLQVFGRMDALINSGGEKVNPAEVERLLRALTGRDELVVLGLADARWGERVVVAHDDGVALDLDGLWLTAEGQIARYKWPKLAVAVEPWPVNAMGKVDRRLLREAVVAAIKS